MIFKNQVIEINSTLEKSSQLEIRKKSAEIEF